MLTFEILIVSKTILDTLHYMKDAIFGSSNNRKVLMRQKILFEVLWWIITLVRYPPGFAPIYLNIKGDFPFTFITSFALVIAVTFIRYIFLLKHHYIVHAKWIKVIFIFIPIPVLLILIDAITNFQAFVYG